MRTMGAVEHLFLGSCTEQLLSQATCDVLIIKQDH
jgi:nucleotide-binding universal stress UspA family protein